MNTNTPVSGLGKTSGWSIVWGILMVLCGFLAIALPLASSIGIVILLAWLILFAGISHFIFAFHAHGAGSVLWQVLLGVLYVAAGIYLFLNPLLARSRSPWFWRSSWSWKVSSRSCFISGCAAPDIQGGSCSMESSRLFSASSSGGTGHRVPSGSSAH